MKVCWIVLISLKTLPIPVLMTYHSLFQEENFIDNTQIESQEEEFIEEATEANEVAVEEVQQEAKEAKLKFNYQQMHPIYKITLMRRSSRTFRKIEVDYTGSDVVRFFRRTRK